MSEADREADDLELRSEIQEGLGSHPRPWSAWLFDQLELPANARVLELAAGTGALWAANAGRLPPGWRMALTDVSAGMIRETRQALAGSPVAGQFSYALADVQAIPAASGGWDAVIANGVFDYLPDAGRRSALAEVRRALAPRGQLYTVTGGQGHLAELEQLVRPFVPEADYGGDPAAFGLENGAQQLAPWFAGVRLLRYDDTLVFRRPEPLLAYLLSESAVRDRLGARQRAALERAVAGQLAARGRVEVAVRKGLFIATRDGAAGRP